MSGGEHRGDPYLVAAHVLGEGIEPVGADRRWVHLEIAEADDDPRLVDLAGSRRLADRHRHPPPVGVGAVYRSLDEWRVDDGLGNSLGLLGRGGLLDRYFDQLLGALAIAGHLLGQGDG